MMLGGGRIAQAVAIRLRSGMRETTLVIARLRYLPAPAVRPITM